MDRILLIGVILNVVVFGNTEDTNQYVKLKPKDRATLECIVPDLTLTDGVIKGKTTITWTKYQEQDGVTNPAGLVLNNGVSRATNMPDEMGLHVDFNYDSQGDEQAFSLQLLLSDVEVGESGKYVCKILYTDSDRISTHTYVVQVLDEVDEVIIYSNLDASSIESSPNTTRWDHQNTVTLGTKTTPYIACVARGGYPLPSIKVYIGDRPVTGLMKLNGMTYSLSGETLYRQMYYTTRLLASNNYPVDVEEDGATIRCEAIVEDQNNAEFSKKVATATLIVNAKPSFNCSTTQRAKLGTEDFMLVCDFLAKPQGTNLKWTAQNTGEIIQRTDGSNNGFTASMKILEGEHRFAGILTISVVREVDFQPYTLSVENSEGISEITITLVEGDTGGSTTGGASILSAVSTILTIVVSALISVSL